MKSTVLFLCLLIFSAQAYAADSKSKTNRENPKLSVTSLLTYTSGKHGNEPDSHYSNGFALQETEIRFSSNIDTWWRGDVTLGIHKEEPETPGEEAEFHLEPEEVFVESLKIPNLTLKFGKFFAKWGRHNELHTHAFPFIDASISRDILFGHEGLNEFGVSLAYLAPLPWYSELIVQVLEGENEAVFGSGTKGDVSSVTYFKNLWDFSDSTTFEVDLGYGSGFDSNKERNHIYNATTFLKWRADANMSLAWTLEYSVAENLVYEGANLGRSDLMSTWLEFQISKPWWFKLRYETLESDQLNETAKKYSAMVSYWHSEFSAIRLQYDNIELEAGEEADERVMLQLNVSIGAHPAHNY